MSIVIFCHAIVNTANGELSCFETGILFKISQNDFNFSHLALDRDAVQAEHGGPGQADGQGQQCQQAGQTHRQQAVQAGQVNRGGQVRKACQVELGQRQLYLQTKIGILLI
jgi:hypothetical protein